MKYRVACYLSLAIGALMVPLSIAVSADANHLAVTFACAVGNDLYTAVARSGYRCPRYGTPEEAIRKAAPSSGVLLLADEYPAARLQIGPELMDRAAEKHLHLYIEYPEGLPGQPAGPVQKTKWERVVVSADSFGERLPRN